MKLQYILLVFIINSQLYAPPKTDSAAGAAAAIGARDHDEDAHSQGNPDEFEGLEYYGVYDGHRGYRASEWASTNLPIYVKEHDAFPQNMHTALKEGFIAADKFILENTDIKSGCTALQLWINKKKGLFYGASLGDSRIILIDKYNKAIQPLQEQTAKRKDIKDFIEQQGGFILKTGMGNFRICGGLIPAGSLGDRRYKKKVNRPDERQDFESVEESFKQSILLFHKQKFDAGHNCNEQCIPKGDLVTNVPDIFEEKIVNYQLAILTTDGIPDSGISNQVAADIVMAELKRSGNPDLAARRLIAAAGPNTGDNKTVVIVPLSLKIQLIKEEDSLLLDDKGSDIIIPPKPQIRIVIPDQYPQRSLTHKVLTHPATTHLAFGTVLFGAGAVLQYNKPICETLLKMVEALANEGIELP